MFLALHLVALSLNFKSLLKNINYHGNNQHQQKGLDT